MKKTISLVLVFAFILALAVKLPALADDASGTPMLISANPEATSTATSTEFRQPEPKNGTSTLEKIPSPAHINLFNQIKKIGNDLFGIRKSTSTPTSTLEIKKATSTPNAIDKKIEDLKKAGLEKITSLENLGLFEKITKIGKDLFGIKKKGAMILPTMTPDLITCTSAAIDAKDVSINISLTNSTTDVTTAIDARGVCQKAALALASGNEDAIKACNKNFQDAVKAANDKAKASQKTTWDAYTVSLKACSATASTTEITIEDGGNVLSK
jgi:hypothetical protein